MGTFPTRFDRSEGWDERMINRAASSVVTARKQIRSDVMHWMRIGHDRSLRSHRYSNGITIPSHNLILIFVIFIVIGIQYWCLPLCPILIPSLPKATVGPLGG